MGSRSTVIKSSNQQSDDSINTTAGQDYARVVGRGATQINANENGLNTGINAVNSTIHAQLDPSTANFLSGYANNVADIITEQTQSFEKSFDNFLEFAAGVKTSNSGALGLNVKSNVFYALIAGAVALFLLKGR